MFRRAEEGAAGGRPLLVGVRVASLRSTLLYRTTLKDQLLTFVLPAASVATTLAVCLA